LFPALLTDYLHSIRDDRALMDMHTTLPGCLPNSCNKNLAMLYMFARQRNIQLSVRRAALEQAFDSSANGGPVSLQFRLIT
jgi:hypothetical protein